VTDDQEPDWLAELAKIAEALRQQIEESGEALRSQVDQLVLSAEQFVRDAQRATPGGPVPPFQQRVVQAVGSIMRGLVPAAGYPTRPGFFRGGVRVEPTVRFVSDGDVITFTETAAVEVVPTREPDLIERNLGRILALVLAAIATSGLLGVQGPDQAAVGYYLTVLSFALAVAVLICAGFK